MRNDSPASPAVLYTLCSRCSSLLASGSVVEAGLHPKPGAVTPCRSHEDKGFHDFALHGAALAGGLLEACIASARASPDEAIAEGLEAYRGIMEAFARSSMVEATNIGLGTALLMVPLAAAVPRIGGCGSPAELAGEASRIALSSGPRAARAYYRLLSTFRPSHLGRYQGPLPDAGGGDSMGFGLPEVLEAARWDHVHNELLRGYPLTLRAYHLMERITSGGRSLRDAALEALLVLLATTGDTLIAAKWGFRAYERALEEARVALALYKRGRVSLEDALEWLDGLWRPRRWNPGAVLDILGAALGLIIASKASRGSTPL